MEKELLKPHLRLVKGGMTSQAETDDRPLGLSLFTAYSVATVEYRDALYHNVRLNWYCLERDEPHPPYESVISNYHLLEPRQRQFLETEVDRLLNEEEVSALRQFLTTHHQLTVVAEEVSLPIERAGPFRRQGINRIFDFIELDHWEGYDLPVRVWGYYSLEGCMTSPVLEAGVEFLELALECLGLKGTVHQDKLRWAVERLYAENALYVSRSKQGS